MHTLEEMLSDLVHPSKPNAGTVSSLWAKGLHWSAQVSPLGEHPLAGQGEPEGWSRQRTHELSAGWGWQGSRAGEVVSRQGMVATACTQGTQAITRSLPRGAERQRHGAVGTGQGLPVAHEGRRSSYFQEIEKENNEGILSYFKISIKFFFLSFSLAQR